MSSLASYHQSKLLLRQILLIYYVVEIEVDVVVGLSPSQRPRDKPTIKMEAAALETTIQRYIVSS